MKTNLIEGEDFYYNEQGYVVLTEKYHQERGYCCGNGCRHCPFDYDSVPEPRRSELRASTYAVSELSFVSPSHTL